VKLTAPEAVKPFVKKGKKNDAADAAAVCVAAPRPDVKFVPIKNLGRMRQLRARIELETPPSRESPGESRLGHLVLQGADDRSPTDS